MYKSFSKLLFVSSLLQALQLNNEKSKTQLPWTVKPGFAVKTRIRDDEYWRKKAIREHRHKVKMFAKLSKPKRKRILYA